MIASASTAEGRAKTYAALEWRNRAVSVLRWAVPGTGLIVLVFLAAKLVIANMVPEISVGGVRLEAGSLVVDTPRFNGTTADGGTYIMVARSATTGPQNPDNITLSTAKMTYEQVAGGTVVATADTATLELNNRRVFVDDVMVMTDSDGTKGTFTKSVIDWTAQTLTSTGPVVIRFKDGSVLEATGALHDQKAQTWVFGPSTLTVPALQETDQ